MSVFFNLVADNNINEENKLMEFNVISSEDIIDGETDYSVGVNRFKIPSGDIDFFRIYPNRYQVAFCYKASVEINDINRKYLVDLYNPNCYNGYTLDKHIVEQSNSRILHPSRYNVIQSNEHFCKRLNRAMANSLYQRAEDGLTSTGGNEITLAKDITLPDYNYFKMDFTGKTSGQPLILGTVTIGNDKDYWFIDGLVKWVPRGGDGGIMNVEDVFEDSSASKVLKMNNLQFELQCDNNTSGASEQKITIPLFSNVGQNVTLEEMLTLFPQGIEYRTSSQIGESDEFYSVVNEIQNTGLPSFIHPYNEIDLHHLLGQNVRNWKFTLTCRYVGGNTAPNLRIFRNKTDNIFFDSLDGLRLKVSVSPDPFFSDIFKSYGNTAGSIQSFPMFDFNKDTQKIELQIQRDWLINRGVSIYVNNGLRSIMGFDVSNNRHMPLNNVRNLFQTVYSDPSVLNGPVEIGFDESNTGYFLRLNDLYPPNTNTSKDSGDIYVTITEEEQSVFKRNYLWGLAIVSPSLPIKGEFINDGKSKLKLITDFVIDPSTNFRDYLVYEPQGSARYYPLRSTQNLREVIVGVYYVDMNQNLNRLTIPQGSQATIKLEFKPNNMIQNYTT